VSSINYGSTWNSDAALEYAQNKGLPNTWTAAS
jgi:hypothetical protein